MRMAEATQNHLFYPRVVTEGPNLLVQQPYVHHWYGDRSAIWNEMRAAGMSGRAIKNTTIYLRESDSEDTQVQVRPRRRLFFHPIRFMNGKDAPKENQILIHLGNKVADMPAQELDRTAHDKVEDGIYYLGHVLEHRKLHNELKFPITWGAVGLAANLLIIQRFFPDLHTSFTLVLLDALHKGLSVPGLLETLPGLGGGFGSGYLVSRGLNVRHVHRYNREEKQFLNEHTDDLLLQTSRPEEVAKGE